MLQCNCHILGDPVTREALVIDPGDEVDRILELLAKHSLSVRAIVSTHAHIDHVGGLAKMQQVTGAPVLMHGDDLDLYRHLDEQAAWLGTRAPDPAKVDQSLREGDTLRWGPYTAQVLHTPGHTSGSLSLYLPTLPSMIKVPAAAGVQGSELAIDQSGDRASDSSSPPDVIEVGSENITPSAKPESFSPAIRFLPAVLAAPISGAVRYRKFCIPFATNCWYYRKTRSFTPATDRSLTTIRPGARHKSISADIFPGIEFTQAWRRILAGRVEGVAGGHRTAVVAGGEPLHALLRGAVGKGVRRHMAGFHFLQTVIAYR